MTQPYQPSPLPTTNPVDCTAAVQAVRLERLLRKTTTVIRPPQTLRRDQWPPNYPQVDLWRASELAKYETEPDYFQERRNYYAKNALEFINHWCDTYDPRNANTDRAVWMPFVLFERQAQLVQFILECMKDEQPGLVEKCRTMGATWVCVAMSVWMWLFHPGVAIGWGSQKAEMVDVLGEPSSIFEKIRLLINRLPKVWMPEGLMPNHLKHYNCRNPQNGATIVGQVGDNIGRGGRTRIYFKDESAHYERPDVIEAALAETTRVPIDISSVNGLGNLFHRKREAGRDWNPGLQVERGLTRVFVMDWRDHPEYTEVWYQQKRDYHQLQGTPHVFAQEIERNYSAAVEGTIIPADWVKAAIDAHVKLNFDDDGPWGGGLDVADGGGDTNALALRKGVVLRVADEWGERDTGVTARRAIAACSGLGNIDVQYDASPIASGVKAETNRLKDDGVMPKNVHLVPWNAGGKVLNPGDRVVPGDRESPRNKDFYTNLKAQGWWELRTRFYKTYQAITEGVKHDPDELISIDSSLPLLRKVEKELCQPTASKGTRMKMVVDKTPDGTRSPNLADAIVMAYWPLPRIVNEFGMPAMGPKIFVEGKEWEAGHGKFGQL